MAENPNPRNMSPVKGCSGGWCLQGRASSFVCQAPLVQNPSLLPHGLLPDLLPLPALSSPFSKGSQLEDIQTSKPPTFPTAPPTQALIHWLISFS